jgi:mRNA-degrading endonuclease YafQ of YafQ-DinJ toxin-antitoxin module
MTPPISRPDLPVRLGPDQRADYAALRTEALRLEALRYLTRLKQHPRLGTQLRDHPTMGDLSDCRKIYFDERADVAPRWRIVYRLLPNADAPTVVEIVSIGRRAYADAYLIAARRLGRSS